MWTPSLLLPEMTSRAMAVVPPMVLLAAPFWMNTPFALGRAFDPVESVPIKSPATTLPDVPESEMIHAVCRLPERTFSEPETVPPIVLLLAPA